MFSHLWSSACCICAVVCTLIGIAQSDTDLMRDKHLQTVESFAAVAVTGSPSNDFNENWIDTLNQQLLLVNQLTARYAWDLAVNPSDRLVEQSTHFNAIKSQWTNARCADIRDYVSKERLVGDNRDLKRMSTILCRGPTLNSSETRQLSAALYAMQVAFVGLAVCLRRDFDVCHGGFAELWRQTYIRTSDGSVRKLNAHKEDIIFRDSSAFRCFLGEPHMDLIMTGDQSPFFELAESHRCTLDTFDATLWAWQSWRRVAGPAVWTPFREAVDLMNTGARRNGYTDIGAVWREELETVESATITMAHLWQSVRLLYERLHAVVRNALWHKVRRTEHEFDRNGSIPAYLLGSMWSQNWSPYAELLMPETDELPLTARVKHKRWTARQILGHADDFYSSMGLPRMRPKFWQKSVLGFENETDVTSCHGTAANMFEADDVRMIFCVPSTGGNLDNAYVAVHEMGHLHYFLGYMSDQPPVFQDAHSAMQEAVGDAVHLGFMVPLNLHRLGLLTDAELTVGHRVSNDDDDEDNNNGFDALYDRAVHGTVDCTDDNGGTPEPEQFTPGNITAADNVADLRLLLRSALVRIAQLPFEYLLDVYRWDLFAGRIPHAELNAHLWHLMASHQGVRPPHQWTDNADSKRQFDAGAKYHVADNTPFARYFLASFLQAQIFRGLCEVTLFGSVRPRVRLPMPLHRCDIYGSRRAGKLLKQAFAIGTSRPWTEVLFILTGYREVRTDAFIEYYKPLDVWLQHLIETFSIPVSW